MTKSKQQIAEALRTAIRGEEDGFMFYDIMARKAVNPEARRKLENLRDDEVRHKRTLHHLYEQYVGGEIGPLPEKGLSVLSEVFRKGQVAQLKTEMQFISLAIEAEIATARFYQTERNLTDDPIFQQVFDRLAEEEHSHFELLQAEKEALAGNYSWFSIEGTQPLEH